MEDALTTLAECVSARWSPTIGDPSPMGWITVAGYAAAAGLAFAAAARTAGGRRARAYWTGLGLALAFLCVNKQLDLQSLLTAAGRCVAQAQGWYARRRGVQLVFVLALGAGAAMAGLWLAVAMRRHLREIGPSLIGLTVLTAFVLMRAVGFHHFDVFIGVRVGGWRMNWVLELGGIGLTALGALWGLRAKRPD